MLNQVTRALAALISPIASQKTGKAQDSSADRDAMGQAYENLHQNLENKENQNPEQDAQGSKEEKLAEVILLRSQDQDAKEKSPEEVIEARKREIGNAQVWMGLVTDLGEQRAAQGDQAQKSAGPDAYEKANAGSSKTARTKKGVILDKKAA